MLRVEHLQKSFEGFEAVKDANLSVEKGEIVAVIGPNGAGKTTLFNLITGHLKPDGGEVFFRDGKITGMPPHRICRRGMGRSYQVVNIFHRLSVFENVRISILSHMGIGFNLFRRAETLAVKETRKVLENLGLLEKANVVCGLLSHGDQKMLEMAIALGNRPELLILDEPTAGMSPEETASAIQLIRKLSGEWGLTILFCEHDMKLVFSIADRIMVMRQGETIIQDSPDIVRNDPRVREAYLGDEHVE